MVPLLARDVLPAVLHRDALAPATRSTTPGPALETARRVLDDYLPSAAAALGRLGLLDDTLLSWLANAVGYDLSVYSPEAQLVATSRRDLYAAGLAARARSGRRRTSRSGSGPARERDRTRG